MLAFTTGYLPRVGPELQPTSRNRSNSLCFSHADRELHPYHFTKDGVETLVVAKAKPGDASYAQTVVLYLMVERYYQVRYAYKLELS